MTNTAAAAHLLISQVPSGYQTQVLKIKLPTTAAAYALGRLVEANQRLSVTDVVAAPWYRRHAVSATLLVTGYDLARMQALTEVLDVVPFA